MKPLLKSLLSDFGQALSLAPIRWHNIPVPQTQGPALTFLPSIINVVNQNHRLTQTFLTCFTCWRREGLGTLRAARGTF